MLLSVIVPVYNVEAYISRCIESLLKQDLYLDYEIILVDDGSPDGSGLICDKYSSAHEYIKTFHKSNGGLSDARNFGLEKACGKYVMFVDSDDYLEEGSMSRICEELKDECDIYCCDFYKLSDGVRADIKYSHLDGIMSGTDFLKYQLEKCTMVTSVVQNIYRKDMLIQNDLYFKKGIYHEDEEWCPRVFLTAKTVKHINIVYYVYVICNGSIMTQKNLTKHISDFMSTFRSLLSAYEGKIDEYLFRLLKDSLVDKYLSIYARGDFGRGTKDIILPAREMKKGLVHRKTKIKLTVWSINRSLFCRISKIYNLGRE